VTSTHEQPPETELAEGVRKPEESVEETIAHGRSSATPFLLLGSVALTVWSVAGLVTLAALAVLWLT